MVQISELTHTPYHCTETMHESVRFLKLLNNVKNFMFPDKEVGLGCQPSSEINRILVWLKNYRGKTNEFTVSFRGFPKSARTIPQEVEVQIRTEVWTSHATEDLVSYMNALTMGLLMMCLLQSLLLLEDPTCAYVMKQAVIYVALQHVCIVRYIEAECSQDATMQKQVQNGFI